jgi:hypothetical protein
MISSITDFKRRLAEYNIETLHRKALEGDLSERENEMLNTMIDKFIREFEL